MEQQKRKRKYHEKPLPKNFYNYFDICKMEGIESTKAKNAISRSIKIEGIKHLNELAPIEHLFEVFEKPLRGGMVNQYGIKRTHYDYFKRTGEAPLISPGRPKKFKDKSQFTNINIELPKKIYDEFKDVVDNANSMSAIRVYYPDMIAVAIKEFTDRRLHLFDAEIPKVSR